MLTRINKFVEKICAKVVIASMCALFFLMCMTGIHVLLRRFTLVSVPDSIGLTECSMIVVIFLSMGYLQMNKGHIRVDIVVDKISVRAGFFLEGVILAISAIVLFVLTYANALQIPIQFESHLATSVLKIPLWPFYTVACIGLFLYAVSATLQAIFAIAKGIKGESAEVEAAC